MKINSTLLAVMVLAIPIGIMLDKLFWFGLGYLTARYLILKNGVPAYIDKERGLIDRGKQAKENIEEQYFEQEENPEEYEYVQPGGAY